MRMLVKNKVKVDGIDVSNTTITVDGNSDSIKKTWLDQLMLFIEVGGVSASDNIVFTIQSSYDNVTWFDQNSSTTITTAINELITNTNVGPYVRIKWDVTGSDVSITGVKLNLVTKGGE